VLLAKHRPNSGRMDLNEMQKSYILTSAYFVNVFDVRNVVMALETVIIIPVSFKLGNTSIT